MEGKYFFILNGICSYVQMDECINVNLYNLISSVVINCWKYVLCNLSIWSDIQCLFRNMPIIYNILMYCYNWFIWNYNFNFSLNKGHAVAVQHLYAIISPYMYSAFKLCLGTWFIRCVWLTIKPILKRWEIVGHWKIHIYHGSSDKVILYESSVHSRLRRT